MCVCVCVLRRASCVRARECSYSSSSNIQDQCYHYWCFWCAKRGVVEERERGGTPVCPRQYIHSRSFQRWMSNQFGLSARSFLVASSGVNALVPTHITVTLTSTDEENAQSVSIQVMLFDNQTTTLSNNTQTQLRLPCKLTQGRFVVCSDCHVTGIIRSWDVCPIHIPSYGGEFNSTHTPLCGGEFNFTIKTE